MDVKDLLRARFAPVPLRLSDASLEGALFVRRLRVPELQRYLDVVSAGEDGRAANLLLLSLCVCDASGAPVFSDPCEAGELLGDLYVEALNQAVELALGSAEGNSIRAPSPRGGSNSGSRRSSAASSRTSTSG